MLVFRRVHMVAELIGRQPEFGFKTDIGGGGGGFFCPEKMLVSKSAVRLCGYGNAPSG